NAEQFGAAVGERPQVRAQLEQRPAHRDSGDRPAGVDQTRPDREAGDAAARADRQHDARPVVAEGGELIGQLARGADEAETAECAGTSARYRDGGPAGAVQLGGPVADPVVEL